MRIFRVRGQSMVPTIPDGSLIIATGWLGQLRSGQVVLVKIAGVVLVKRLIERRRQRWVIGNVQPWGSVNENEIMAVVRLILPPVFCAKRGEATQSQ